MNYKLPSFLYAIRIIIFVALLSSLLWMSSVISTVLYLVAVAFYICDFIVSSKYVKTKVGATNKILFLVLDRMIVLMPFFFACLYVSFEVWVFIIIVVFEIVVNMYRFFDETNGISKKISNALYYIYNTILYIGAILFMSTKLNLATYMVFAATIIAAIFVIYSSINFTKSEGDDDSNNDIEKKVVEEKIIEESSLSDEIVE